MKTINYSKEFKDHFSSFEKNYYQTIQTFLINNSYHIILFKTLVILFQQSLN